MLSRQVMDSIVRLLEQGAQCRARVARGCCEILLLAEENLCA